MQSDKFKREAASAFVQVGRRLGEGKLDGELGRAWAQAFLRVSLSQSIKTTAHANVCPWCAVLGQVEEEEMTDAQVNMLATQSQLYDSRHKEIVELGMHIYICIYVCVAIIRIAVGMVYRVWQSVSINVRLVYPGLAN